eukprot:3545736-Prorocentrum_lima.AAC.1
MSVMIMLGMGSLLVTSADSAMAIAFGTLTAPAKSVTVWSYCKSLYHNWAASQPCIPNTRSIWCDAVD